MAEAGSRSAPGSRANFQGHGNKSTPAGAHAGTKVPQEVTDAIRDGEEIPDARLSALSEFTRVMFEKRGNPSQEETKAFLEAGYQEKQILEIVLALAVKTLSNYSNHIFQTPLDDAFSSRKWSKRQRQEA